MAKRLVTTIWSAIEGMRVLLGLLRRDAPRNDTRDVSLRLRGVAEAGSNLKIAFLSALLIAMALLTQSASAATEFVCSIKQSGGDYSILNSWAAANQCDLTTSVVLSHGVITGTIADGSFVKGATSLAYGTVTHVTTTQICIKGITGTFVNGEVINKTDILNGTPTGVDYVTATSVPDSVIAVAKIDGTWTVADTTAVTISGWTTSATNYIKIYTTSFARHNGKWNTGAYRLEVTAAANSTSALDIKEEYVRIEGLQIQLTNSGGWTGCKAINIDSQVTASDIRLSQNIIKGAISLTTSEGIGIYGNDADITAKIYNNIIYDFINGAVANNMGISTATGGSYYLYNNTLQGSYVGVNAAAGTVIAKNNIFSGCTTAASGTFAAGTNYNATNNASMGYTVTGAGNINDKVSQTFAFVAEATDDFHLAGADTAAKDAGIDLSADTYLAFTSDIDGAAGRPAAPAWDIGADESATATFNITATIDDVTLAPPTATFNITATLDDAPPGAPTGATIASGTWNTNWIGNANKSAVKVSGSKSSDTVQIKIEIDDEDTFAASKTTTLTGLGSGTTYADSTGIDVTTVTALADGNIAIRITAYDAAGNASTPQTVLTTAATFKKDTVAPTGLANLAAPSATSSTATLTWTAATDANFNHYEIWYGTVLADVTSRSGTALEWDNDPNDVNLATATTTTTTITGLTAGLTYYFKIWAVDNAGNEMTTTEVSKKINNKPLGGYTADNVIPAAQCVQATDGTGLVTISFRVKDADLNACTLNTFKYSVDGGTTFNAPTNADSSGALSTGWTNNSGTNYASSLDWTGTVYSFTFNTKHADVTGLNNVDQSDVQVQFLVNDGFDNSVSPAISANFRVDDASHSLSTWDLNMNTGVLTLHFNEAVKASTFTSTGIILQNAATATTSYTLTGGTTSSPDGLDIAVNLTSTDLNAIKANANLAKSATNSYLRITTAVIKDLFENSATAIADGSAVAVTTYTADSTVPTLSNWTLNMQTGSLGLTFSETMDASTLDVTKVIVQDLSTATAGKTYTLTNSTGSTTDSTGITITLSTTDLNALKAIEGLAKASTNSFIRFSALAINDMAATPNVLAAIADGSAVAVTTYTADTTAPTLSSWTLNMQTGSLGLTFSETMDASTLDVTKVIVQDLSTATAGKTYTLTNSTGSTTDSTGITITLSTTDLNALKAIEGLAKASTNSFIRFSALAINDMAATPNVLAAIADGSAVLVTTYTADSSTPTLTSWTLNMNTGSIALTFSESMNASSLDVTKVIIQDAAIATSGKAYTLTNSTGSNTNSTLITITLSTTDLNAIKAIEGLAKASTNSYIRFGTSAITDMAATPNALAAIADGSAVLVTTYTADSSTPTLTNWTLNMNTGSIGLTFSETMDASTLDVTKVIVQDLSTATAGKTYTLTNSTGSTTDSTGITITLSTTDLNALKAIEGLAKASTNSFIRFSALAINDMAATPNVLAAIADGSAVAVTTYTADTTAPTLSSWTLNMQTGSLGLTFSETMDASTLDVTKVIVQDLSTATAGKTYTLTNSTGSTTDSTGITITLSTTDLNALKAIEGLAKASTNSFIRFSALAINDMAATPNVLAAIADGSAVAVTTYTADTTAPTLSSWTLNMQTHKLTLNFSEPVKASSWTPTAVTLQDTAATPTKTYALTAGSTTASSIATNIVIDLSTADFNALIDYSGGGLCTNSSNSYLTITTNAIKDLADNNVTAVSTGMLTVGYTANTVTATNFKVLTSTYAISTTMTAGTTKAIAIRAYDASGYRCPSYAGTGASAKTLVFSGASTSLDGYVPTARNNSAVDINFASNTTVNFTNGEGTSTLILYCKESGILIKATEGTIITANADALTVTVNPEVKTKLVFSQQPSSTGIINAALTQQPIVVIRDTYGNQTADIDNVRVYDSSSNTFYADASGILSSDHLNNTVAAVGGTATFSGVKYNTLGTIYLYAESGTLQPTWSNAITFSTAGTSRVDVSATPVTNFNLIPTNDTEAEKFSVLKFKITDIGGDATATLVDRIKIAIGGTGLNASTDIVWAELIKGASTRVATATGAAITNTDITFGSTANSDSVAQLDTVADNTSTEYTVYIYMKNSKLTATEGQAYTFTTNETLVSTDTGTSSGMAANTNSITTVTATIAVAISHLEIVDATTGNATASLTAGQTVELKIRGTDSNKNVDTNYIGNHTLLFSGLSTIGVYKPLIEAVAFGYNITINFVSGESTANAVTLTAYAAETLPVSVAEVGVSPAYTVFTCSATVSSTTAVSIALTSGNAQVGKTSKALPTALVATVSDTYGNIVQGTSVTFAVSSYPTGATGQAISGTQPATTGATGQASTTLTLGNLAGIYQATATSGTLTGSPVTFSATGRVPSQIIKSSGDAQSQIINTTLSSAFVATLADANGAAIPNETMNFAIQSYPTGATGQTISASLGTTDVNGQASTALTLGTKTGDYIVRTSYIGVTPNLSADFTGTATAAVPYKVVLTGPSSVTAGTVSSAFTITVKDQYDNVVVVETGKTLVLDMSASIGTFYSDAAGTTAVTQRTITAGASAAAFYYKHTIAGTTNITATRNSVSSTQALTVTSDAISNFTIVPADLSYFMVSGDTTAMTAGGSRIITVTAYDVYNNPKTNTGTINVTFSGANPSPSAQAPTCSNASATDVAFGSATSLTFNSSGQATSTLKVYKAETVAIKASSGSATTSSTNDLDIIVIHAASDHLKFAANLPSPQTVGVAFNFETNLNAVDLYANLCDGANGATAYTEASKTVTWTLSGLSNAPDGSANDVLTNPVSFLAGVSTTALSATLYRAQSTTITPSVVGLIGTNTASNSITVNAGAINKLFFSQQPSGTGTTAVALATQPAVSVSDAYGNATTAAGQIILGAYVLSGGNYVAATNGSLSSDFANNTKTLVSGVAAFTGVKYSYPETIYLQASVTGQSLTVVYSNQVVLSATNELTVAAVTAGLSNTVSSIANTSGNKVAVFAFQVTDAGADGFGGVLKKIIINRGSTDTHDWTSYINDAIISDGTNELLGTIAASTFTFGDGTSTIYTVPNNSNKTYTLYITTKNPLPTGADGESLSFSMDADTDLTMGTPVSSTFAASAAISRSATIDVALSVLKITGTATMNAGGSNTITLKAIDANANIDKDYTGNKTLTFSGASSSPDATVPTCSNYIGVDKPFGSSDPPIIAFTSGQATSAMKLYKAEVATIAVTDGTYSAATSNRLSVTVSTGSASKLFWNTQPVTKVAASAPWKLFTVGVTDAYGNTASSATNSVTLTPTGGTTGSGATATVDAVAGLANFTNYSLTCASYPGTVTLNATATGLTASGASNEVTVAENYAITINAKDSVTASQLTSVALEILNSSGTTVYGPTTSNSPFSLSLAYGTYTVKLSKEKYVDSSSELTAGVPADGTDGTYDNTITWTIYITSVEEATADYKVMSSFVYDEVGEDLAIRLWLERRGKLVVNSDLNKLGNATIAAYDDTAAVWFSTITLSAPASTDYTTGTYVKTVNNVLTAGNDFGRVMTAGKTYYAKCKISYGGSTGTTTYEGGTTFTLPVSEKLSREIIDKLGVAAGETLVGKIAEVKSETTKIVTATETTIPAKVAEVKGETAKILTAAETTIPTKITEAKTAITDVVKSEILNRDNIVRSGQALTIRYRTYTGLSPAIDVYDASNVLKVDKAAMTEIGTTGIYEKTVTFESVWGRGDFSIVCSESTKGTMDAMTISVLRTDMEQVYGQVSSILGNTSGISGLRTVADSLNNQFAVIESVLSRVGKNLVSQVKEAASSALGLESIFTQLSNVAKQVKQISGEAGINLEKLYQVSVDKKQDIDYLKNKTQQLKASVEMSTKMVDNIANKPITQTWYEYKK